MSFDFIVLGIFFIFILFYVREDNMGGLTIIKITTFLFLIGYFIKSLLIGSFYINLINLLTIFIAITLMILLIKPDISKSIYIALIECIIYVLINFVFIDCNIYFSIIPFIAISIIIGMINLLKIKEWMLSIFLSIVTCEFFNMFFMLKKVNYVTLFQQEIVIFVMVNFLACFCFNSILNKIWKVSDEKNC